MTDKKPKEIGFKVYENLGGTVNCLPDLPGDDPINRGLWPADFIPRPITDRDGLVPGQWVLVWGGPMQVGKHQHGPGEDDWELQLKSGDTIGILEYGQDDRNCWVCGGVFNKRALEKLEICR